MVSGELVDSPYDPFADDKKAVGHDRKRQRLSWSNDARWTINDNVPSPSKRNARDDWIRDEDLQSPKKRREPITPTSPSPEEPIMPITKAAPRPASHAEPEPDTQTYAQELVDLVGGDTEEEDFSQMVEETGEEDREEPVDDDVAAVQSAFGGPNIFASKKFSVFRDFSVDTPLSASTGSLFSKSRVEEQQEQDLWREEQQFFDLPSSDPVHAELPTESETLPNQIQQEEQPEATTKEDSARDLAIARSSPSTPKTRERQTQAVAFAESVDDAVITEDAHRDDGLTLTPAKQSSTRHESRSPGLRIKDMPPPLLPTLRTAHLDSPQTTNMPPPPKNALPASPKTPDLQPQKSAALPLPSPFPGEELSSYMETSPSIGQNAFAPPPATESHVLPDWMLQIGFGFGSQGFMRGSPPKTTPPIQHVEGDEQLEQVIAEPGIEEEAHAIVEELTGDVAEQQMLLLGDGQDKSEVKPEMALTPSIPEFEPIRSPAEEAVEVADLPRSTQLDEDDVVDLTQDMSSPKPQEPPSQAVKDPIADEAAEEFSVMDSQPDDESEEEESEVDSDEDLEGDESEDGLEGEESDALSEGASDDVDVQSEVQEPSSPLLAAAKPSIPSMDGSRGDEKSSSPRSLGPLMRPSQPPASSIPVVIDLMDSDSEDGDDDAANEQAQLPHSTDVKMDITTAGKTATPKPLLSRSQRAETSDAPEAGSLYQPSFPTRSGVSFAPEVTRRRAAANAESAAEFEPQSSAPLANSQPHFRPPHLRVQDTYEGMVHLDGSLMTAPPPRGSNTSRFDGPDDEMEHGEDDLPKQIQETVSHDEIRSYDGAYDGVVEFIASSPPAISSANEHVVYPDLPPLGMLEDVQQPSEARQDMTVHSHLPFTPDASQHHSQQPTATAIDTLQQQDVQLPLTPHQTQVEQSFEGHDLSTPRVAPDYPDISVPEMVETKSSPAKAGLHSDGASSFLSPWFNVKSSNRVGTVEDGSVEVKTQRHSTLEGEQIKSDQYAQLEGTTIRLSPTPASPTQKQIIASQIELPDFSFTQSQAIQAKGFLTSISYYTPIGALFSCIRLPTSNSQAYNDGCVDVIAVVTKGTTKPLRADKGQRDYYTTLSITDEHFYPRNIRVQVFRPWRAALPQADKGDVVLLRGFEVFSAKGNVGVGLKSAESAAWCVWRFGEDNAALNLASDEKPWAKREKDAQRGKEEMRGPPVELGDQEREYAQDLRSWWHSIANENLSSAKL